jgi:ABC-type proline/glycine betaine transport system permease subunit
MAQPVSTQPEMPAMLPGRKVASAIVVGSAALGAVVLAGALGLWFHYGTAVFFEMITSGISACF